MPIPDIEYVSPPEMLERTGEPAMGYTFAKDNKILLLSTLEGKEHDEVLSHEITDHIIPGTDGPFLGKVGDFFGRVWDKYLKDETRNQLHKVENTAMAILTGDPKALVDAQAESFKDTIGNGYEHGDVATPIIDGVFFGGAPITQTAYDAIDKGEVGYGGVTIGKDGVDGGGYTGIVEGIDQASDRGEAATGIGRKLQGWAGAGTDWDDISKMPEKIGQLPDVIKKGASDAFENILDQIFGKEQPAQGGGQGTGNTGNSGSGSSGGTNPTQKPATKDGDTDQQEIRKQQNKELIEDIIRITKDSWDDANKDDKEDDDKSEGQLPYAKVYKAKEVDLSDLKPNKRTQFNTPQGIPLAMQRNTQQAIIFDEVMKSLSGVNK